MIKFFSTTLFLFGAQLAFSQFKGVIIDQTTRQPLADVHVAVINSSLGTITDKEGKFVLDNSSSDFLRLLISAIGYSTIEHVAPPLHARILDE